MVTGIICEYNPLHLGHQKQICYLKEQGSAVVCLMSGNFVQRGHPAVFDKMLRAEAAMKCGADLVLELPITAALSSAEGFAAKGVQILSPICDALCFGAEHDDAQQLTDIAKALLSEEFRDALHLELEKGLSFPSARQNALSFMGYDGTILEKPNNILAVEYCKSIAAQHSPMQPMAILRNGNYHDLIPDKREPSATAIRKLIYDGAEWQNYVPQAAYSTFKNAAAHMLANGENAILGKLRTMTDQEFEALPFGSEGLWRKLMHAARSERTLEDILTATKSKRYTRTRIDRMVMCAFLGITQSMMQTPAPYTRVLAFNDTGRKILKDARKSNSFVNAGEIRPDAYQLLEDRCGDLYGLFAKEAEMPGRTRQERVYYFK